MIFHLITSQKREFYFANYKLQFHCEITQVSSKAETPTY